MPSNKFLIVKSSTATGKAQSTLSAKSTLLTPVADPIHSEMLDVLIEQVGEIRLSQALDDLESYKLPHMRVIDPIAARDVAGADRSADQDGPA